MGAWWGGLDSWHLEWAEAWLQGAWEAGIERKLLEFCVEPGGRGGGTASWPVATSGSGCSRPLDCWLLLLGQGISASSSLPVSLPSWPRQFCCHFSIQKGHKKGRGPGWHESLRHRTCSQSLAPVPHTAHLHLCEYVYTCPQGNPWGWGHNDEKGKVGTPP